MRRMARRINSFFKQTSMETHFNTPFKFPVSVPFVVNERIVEIPFVFSELPVTESKLKIMDFGCARSWIAIALASMGHDVLGVDLRDYPFTHKNFSFAKKNLLHISQGPFDAIVSVSVLEHVGLGAYSEGYNPDALTEVFVKMRALLSDTGKLIATVPVGLPSIDRFMRSFTPGEIMDIARKSGFIMQKGVFYRRTEGLQWLPCSRKKVESVSNRYEDRKKMYSGVNGLGCMVFSKSNG